MDDNCANANFEDNGYCNIMPAMDFLSSSMKATSVCRSLTEEDHTLPNCYASPAGGLLSLRLQMINIRRSRCRVSWDLVVSKLQCKMV